MDTTEFCVLIKHCFLMEKNTVQAAEWLEKCYGRSAPTISTVRRVFGELRKARKSSEAVQLSGRHPVEETSTPDDVKTLHQLILWDRKIKIRDLVETAGITIERVKCILQDHLLLKKLRTRWVPRLLTVDIEDPNGTGLANTFLRRYITMDANWINHYALGSEDLLTLGKRSHQKKRAKKQSSKQLFVNIFWDSNGMVHLDMIDKNKMINSDYYIDFLSNLEEILKHKQPLKAAKKVHNAVSSMSTMAELGYEVLPFPPYCPNLKAIDYSLFPNVKHWVQGANFSLIGNMLSIILI